MQIEIIKPGLQTTIQDNGRYGWMHMGFSHSGAMDSLAMAAANWLVHKNPKQPVLEFTLTGPDIIFHDSFQIAITGAPCHYELDGKAVATYQTLSISAGQMLSFKAMPKGCRGYIAFRQNMETEQYLDSSATHVMARIGGLDGRQLQTGDKLSFQASDAVTDRVIATAYQPQYLGNYQIRITPAPETSLFSTSELETMAGTSYNVTKDHSRMGIRLSSNADLSINVPEMRSRGLLPGAVQIPPGGQPIIAGADAQTTGGYPRLGQVIKTDLPLLGQLRVGDQVSLQMITLAQAHGLLTAQQQQLQELFSE